jgi:hypothetical protein
MIRLRELRSGLAISALCLLAACGGGGGGENGPPNQTPQIVTATLQTDEDVVLSATLVASDPDGDTLSFAKASDVRNGTLQLTSAGAITYTPASNFNGTDSFAVQVADGRGGTASGTVAITVRQQPDGPIATDDGVRVEKGTTVLRPKDNDLHPDGDTFSLALVMQPGVGTATLGADETVTFVSPGDFEGPVEFTYRLTDAHGRTAEGTVRLVVGQFQGVVLISDDTTPSRDELHYFDGLRTVRLNPGLPAGRTVQAFRAAGNGRIAYVVGGALGSGDTRYELWLTDVATPAVARLIYTYASTPLSAAGLRLALSPDAAYAIIADEAHPSGYDGFVVRMADGQVASIAGTNQQLGGPDVNGPTVFNPANGEVYEQVVRFNPGVGGIPPMAMTAFKLTQPASLIQFADMTGFAPAVTPDGRYVVYVGHVNRYPDPGGDRYSLRVADRVSGMNVQIADDLAVPFEGAAPVSPDGVHVCYVSGARVWIAEILNPATAVAVTSMQHAASGCQWAGDNATVLYGAADDALTPRSVWSIDTSQPAGATRLHPPLNTDEAALLFPVETSATHAIVQVRRSLGAGEFEARYYSTSLASGSSPELFETVTRSQRAFVAGVDARGSLLLQRIEAERAPQSWYFPAYLSSAQVPGYRLRITKPLASATNVQFLPATP